MSIKQCLEYNKKLDIIEGFEDLGPLGRKPKDASNVLVFSIRGIYSSWKFPLAYFFSHGATSKENLKFLIHYILKTLHEIGFIPKAVVCDQGSSNRAAFKLLNITKEQPYFYFMDSKIFALFDVPHLFKSVRNNLLSGTFKLAEKTISFNVIRKTYEIDKSSLAARTLPKITEKHINPNAFEKMPCSLALQVFSNTMAAAIKTCVSKGFVPSNVGRHTADFVELMNNLFDALNSKRPFAKNPYNCGLSEYSSSVNLILQEGKSTFRSLIKLSHKTGKTEISESRPPCFDGIIQTINAIEQLFENEKKRKIFSLYLQIDSTKIF